jgi:hypothetical protein
LTITGYLSARENASFDRRINTTLLLAQSCGIKASLSSRASDQFEAEIIATAFFTMLLEQPKEITNSNDVKMIEWLCSD